MTDDAEPFKAFALANARTRAFAALETDGKIRNPDNLAREFLKADERPDRKHAARITQFRSDLEVTRPGAYYFETARTIHIDTCLRQAIKDGFRQVVLLGAGFDTRAYRFFSLEQDVQFFEIDFPQIQFEKKAALEHLASTVSGNVHYLPTDFDRDNLPDLIETPGYDVSEPTFFIWESRSFTVTDDDVDALLDFVSFQSVPDSRIVFDYIPRSMVDSSVAYYGGEEFRVFMAQSGRPLSFGIEDRNLRRFLAQRNFELTSLLADQELQNRYLIGSAGTLQGRVPGYVRIAEATITRRRGT